jgi:transposase
MKPYSSDLREKIIQAYRNGDSSLRDTAERFLVSLNFVWLLWQRYLATGSVEPKPHAGGHVSVMTLERLSILRDLVEEQNDATLNELQEKFHEKTGIFVSSGTISSALKKLKLPRKKKTFHATERENNPEIIQKREEYIQKMPTIDTQHAVIVDEFGINLGMAREYGRAPPGQRAEGHRPCNPGENITVIAGLSCHGIIAPLMFPGAINGEIFKVYVEQVLVPELKSGDVVIIDNLSSHKVQGIEQTLKDSGMTLKFLPPYSPDLSPMEQAISKIKGELRKIAARSYEPLVDAVKQALSGVSSNNALGWYKGCGYCIEAK